MNLNDRARELRKNLGLTQADFGEKIGLKQAVIGQMEKGARNLTDRTILLICDKYNVNEEWLRDGKGPIFKESDKTIISNVASKYRLDDFDKEILKIYLELDINKRKIFRDFASLLVNTVLDDNFFINSKAKGSKETVEKFVDENTDMPLQPFSSINNDKEYGPKKIKIFRAAKSKSNGKPEMIMEAREKISKLKAAPKVTRDEDF